MFLELEEAPELPVDGNLDLIFAFSELGSPSYPGKPSKPKKKLMVAAAFLVVFIVLLRKSILSRKGV